MADFDFDPPSFSLGIDLDVQSEPQTDPPSFSLGIDLDIQSEPQADPPSFSLGIGLDAQTALPPDSIPHSAKRPSTASNLPKIEEDDDDDFESPIKVSAPPRSLKRLRLGPKARPPPPPAPDGPYEDRRCNVDDEIEDFSSDEDFPRGSLPSNSVCSSSKPSLHGKKVVTSESGKQFNSTRGKEVPSASASINVETKGSNVIFPKLTVSPLRRFQLIDSDSDDPSTIEDKCEEMPSVIYSEDKKSDYCEQAAVGNQGNKTSVGIHQITDLWKNFCPEKTCKHIPTPAFDEFCEEYFTGSKNMTMQKSNHKDIGNGRATDETSRPPSHCYFFHNDPRIQKLVRERLPHFIPLEVGNNQEYKQQNVSVIDYMAQFGSERNSGQTSRKQNVEKSSTSRKKNTKNSQVDSFSEESGKWVTPKSSSVIQKNAGSRRVQAVSGGSGHWYTGQDGRRVYVTKNGQELSGQIAYRHYKKESGKGFKSSKKKTTAKKKTASKK